MLVFFLEWQAVPPSIAHLYASSASLPSPTQRMLVELSGSPVRRRRFATESPASHASHSQDRHQTAPSTLSRVSPPTAGMVANSKFPSTTCFFTTAVSLNYKSDPVTVVPWMK